MRGVLLALTAAAALLSGVLLLQPFERDASAALEPARAVAAPVSVRFTGGDAAALPLAEAALRRVFETPIGRQARELLDSGTLGGPLTIELNLRGDNFTHYRIPGRELGRAHRVRPDEPPARRDRARTAAGLARDRARARARPRGLRAAQRRR